MQQVTARGQASPGEVSILADVWAQQSRRGAAFWARQRMSIAFTFLPPPSRFLSNMCVLELQRGRESHMASACLFAFVRYDAVHRAKCRFSFSNEGDCALRLFASWKWHMRTASFLPVKKTYDSDMRFGRCAKHTICVCANNVLTASHV